MICAHKLSICDIFYAVFETVVFAYEVEQLSISLTKVVKLYARGGFVVYLVLMDMEFEKIKDKFDKIKINMTAVQEHVCEIEGCNQAVKERSRGTISEMRDVGFNFFH